MWSFVGSTHDRSYDRTYRLLGPRVGLVMRAVLARARAAVEEPEITEVIAGRGRPQRYVCRWHREASSGDGRAILGN